MTGSISNLVNQLLNRDRDYLVNTVTNWGVVVVGLFVSQGFNALALLLIAKHVSPIEYSQYIASFALLSLLVVIPNFGLDNWLLTRSALSTGQLVGTWKRLTGVRSLLLAGWFLLVLLLNTFLPKDTYPVAVMIPTALSLALESLALFGFAALRTINHHRSVTLMQAVAATALLLFAVLLPDADGMIVVYSWGRVLVFSLMAAAVYLSITRRFSALPPEPGETSTGQLKSSFHFMLSDLAASTYFRAHISVVSLFLGTAGSSVYGPAINIINMSFLVPNALYYVVLPILSRLFKTAPDKYRLFSWLQTAANLLAGGALSAGIYFFAEDIIRFSLGTAYLPSTPILRLAALIPLIKSLNFSFGSILTSSGQQDRRMLAQVVCALFNIAANLAVVGTAGLAGITVVYLLSEILLAIGYFFFITRTRPASYEYSHP